MRRGCKVPKVLRGLPFSTYALRGGGGLKKLVNSANDKTDRLREMRTSGREGVKNPENFAYGFPKPPKQQQEQHSPNLGPTF